MGVPSFSFKLVAHETKIEETDPNGVRLVRIHDFDFS